MDVWTFVWLMVFLKIPIVALFLIVRWAVNQTTETEPGQDGGIGPRPSPHRPHHPRARIPRRRGPHGDPVPASPARTRTLLLRGRPIFALRHGNRRSSPRAMRRD